MPTSTSVWYSCRAMTVRRLSISSATVVAVAAAAVAATAAPGAVTPPRWIVFSGHPDGAGLAQLFRVGLDGSGLKQITTGKLPATAPSFSPDGRQIVFTRLGSGIFRVSVDGTGLRRLSSGPRDSYPVWSPDGKTIAFLRPYETLWRVYVMSASGADKRRLGFSAPAGRPSWAADGKAVLVPAAGSLASIDPKSGKVEKILGVTLNPETAQSVTVSPNGRTVTWVDSRISTGPPDCGEGRCPQYALYRSDVSGKGRRRIANDTGPAGWSPDGRRLVFLLQGALTLFDVASGTKTKLNTGPHTAAGDAPPAWQPR
jgi:TolB protein